ncbi:NB-ARC domain-containing protein [Defluviicoccus vanus]|nr:NB-ARC domain-containing protein [Defluviicoccus vanus]
METIAGGAVGSIATGAIAALSGGGISLIAGLAAVGGTIAALAVWQRIALPKIKIRLGDAPAAATLPEAELAALHGVPEQKPNFVPRDDDLGRVKGILLASDGPSVGITASRPGSGEMAIGLHGMGGIGKTELAVTLAHDDDVRAAFPDGIFWLTLGQTPDLLPLQASLWRMLSGSEPAFADAGAGQRVLLDLFKDRAALIVLDDIWRLEHAAPLAVAGPRGRLLTTTRDASLLTALGAREVSLDVLGEDQALQLLANWSGQDRDALPDAAKAVAKECGCLPLALALAGAQVKDGRIWTDVLAALKQGDLEFLDHPYGSVFKSLRASVEALPEDQATRYGELAVALEDVPLPVAAVARLWRQTAGLEPHTSRKLLQTFASKALLSLAGEGDAAAVGFHDLQYDFLRLNADDPRAPHRALIDAYRDEIGAAWARLSIDDPYLWPRLADHLLAAGWEGELRALLLDYRWLAAKLAATDINALLADYDRLPGDEDLRLIQQALRLSAHVLAKQPDQLPSQLTGRLRGIERPALMAVVDRIEREAPRPWLSPQTTVLTPPGGSLIAPSKATLVALECTVWTRWRCCWTDAARSLAPGTTR